jgi:hypothetical protein
VHPGLADLIAIKNGYVVFIECKRPDWKPSSGKPGKTETAQRAFAEQVTAAGGHYALIRDEEEMHRDIEVLDRLASVRR